MSQTKDQAPSYGAPAYYTPGASAYYAPVVAPPPQQAYSGRRERSFLSTVSTVIIVIGVVIGIAVLITWLALRPNKLKFYVVSADLTQFNLTNGNNLGYNLSLDMAVRNPNRKIGVYYDRLIAAAAYDGERFGWTSLPSFYQGHKSTTMIRPTFRGQSVIGLGTSGVNKFDAEKNTGVFLIDIKIYIRLRFKIGSFKTRAYKPDVECDLRIPLASNRNSAARFESQRCDFDF